MIACSFSGHRHIPKEHEAGVRDLLARAVAYAYGEGCRTFYTGGALGFDTMAAEEIVRFRLSHRDARFIVLIPCPGQEDGWSEWAKEHYRFLLASADEVEYVSSSYYRGCMQKRNRALVERAQMLVCYVSHEKSGASQTAAMARKAGLRVYNLYPALTGENTRKTGERSPDESD